MFYRTLFAPGLVIDHFRKHYILIFMEKLMFCSQEGAFLYRAVLELTLLFLNTCLMPLISHYCLNTVL